MRKITIIIIILFLGSISNGYSDSFEFISGASYQTFDDYSEYDDFGMTVNTRYLRYNSGSSYKHGLFLAMNFPAMYITVFDALAGYGIRSSGNAYWELGAGVSYSPVWSTNIAGMLGVGMKFGSTWYLSIPATISSMGMTIIPMIGYYF